MQVTRIHRQKTKNFDDQQLNLVYHQETYLDFIQRPFSLQNLGLQMKEKSLPGEVRKVLAEVLCEQYADLPDSELVRANISALEHPNCFTVVTGHQLSLFTGPLYFILKILHAIRLSEALKKEHPEKHFVPIYWMASEDHDFAEVQSAHLFNRTITWKSEQGGAVGRFSTEGLEHVRNEISELFANHPEAEIHALLERFDGTNYAEATRSLVHSLFERYGLVIVDADHLALKKVFLPIVQQELTDQFSQKAVEETNEHLKRQGAKLQVNPREINLFYLTEGRRDRIELREKGYYIDGIGARTLEELLNEAKNHPERFSPNVILRPLYQEMILPNLAYIGGLGEITYWLQLKGVFDAAGVPFPLLNVRNSLVWIEGNISKRLDKLEVHLEDIFHSADQLKRSYVEMHAGEAMKWEIFDETTRKLMSYMDESVAAIDPSKQGFAESEKVKLEKQMEAFKEKMIRFAKGNHDDAMKQIELIKERLFPGDGLQERKANFFSFCPDGNYSRRLEALYNAIDPFDGDLILLREI